MRHVKIIIEHQPEDVWLATSEELPGFTVESEDRDEIFDLARRLAFEFLHLDAAADIKKDGKAVGDQITFDFEVRE